MRASEKTPEHYRKRKKLKDKQISKLTRRLTKQELRLLKKRSVLTYNASRNAAINKCRTRADRGLAGLKNLGNTCYMNCVLQCLSKTPRLAALCISRDPDIYLNHKSKTRGKLFTHFTATVQNMWMAREPISPKKLKRRMDKFAPQFKGNKQHDSQELLLHLLQGLHEDINRVRRRPERNSGSISEDDENLSLAVKAQKCWKMFKKADDSPITDMFLGQLCSTLACIECGQQSSTFETFWDISLPIPSEGGATLHQCLGTFMAGEMLTDSDMPMCSGCKQPTATSKRYSLQRLPHILVVHLKRFEATGNVHKLRTRVNFESTLDLSPYLSDTCHDPAGRARYELYGVCNHSGSFSVGHYTAYARHPTSSTWWMYDDTRVDAVNFKSVVSREAYLLFYQRARSFPEPASCTSSFLQDLCLNN